MITCKFTYGQRKIFIISRTGIRNFFLIIYWHRLFITALSTMSDSDAEFESADEGADGERANANEDSNFNKMVNNQHEQPEDSKFSTELKLAELTTELKQSKSKNSELTIVSKHSELKHAESHSEISSASLSRKPNKELPLVPETNSDIEKTVDSEKDKSENASSNDEKIDVSALFDKLSNTNIDEKQNSSDNAISSWEWGSWGVSLVTKAAKSVSEFTTQFGEGIRALEIPDPQELAQQHREEELKFQFQQSTENSAEISFTDNEPSQSTLLTPLLSLSNVIEKTGSAVLTTGLDTLELIGKKTMDVLQDGDPGLKKKIAYFNEAKPNLSEILREAKNQSTDSSLGNDSHVKKTFAYSVLFDECQGLVHLEALEMLSKENEETLSNLLRQGSYDEDILLEVNGIEELCNFEDLEDILENAESVDFLVELKSVSMINAEVKISRLKKIHEDTILNFVDYDAQCDAEMPPNVMELHCAAIKILADFTAASMEFLHKLAELISLDEFYPDDLTDNVCSALKLLCHEVNYISLKYSEYLNKPIKYKVVSNTSAESIAAFTTEIYLEASNSITYLQDALRLLAPILQLTYLKCQSKISS